MAISVALQLQAKPGEGDRLIEVMNSLLEDTGRMEGALGHEVWRDLDHGDNVMVIERWRERANHEAYVRWREETGAGRAELAGVLAAPPTYAYYETVGESQPLAAPRN
jgi:quinol monooxygenase YgiN